MENKNKGKKFGKGLEALLFLQSKPHRTADEIFIEIVEVEKTDKTEFNRLIKLINNLVSQKGSEQS